MTSQLANDLRNMLAQTTTGITIDEVRELLAQEETQAPFKSIVLSATGEREEHQHTDIDVLFELLVSYKKKPLDLIYCQVNLANPQRRTASVYMSLHNCEFIVSVLRPNSSYVEVTRTLEELILVLE